MTISNLLIVLVSLALRPGEGAKPVARDNLGQKIATVQGDKFVFVADTITLKRDFERIINMPEVKLEKIEVLKRKTFGDREEDYYMLIAYDHSMALKTTRWLVNHEGSLYYYHCDFDEETTDDEIFYVTFFTCYGSKTNCFPMVAHLSDGYMWGGSTDLVCRPDDPCRGIKTVEMEE